ncbi:MAG: penicillin-binding protein activator [Methylotenera sp.]|nr:penicillin-binding protein activator [Oligoflexia bacterium]
MPKLTPGHAQKLTQKHSVKLAVSAALLALLGAGAGLSSCSSAPVSPSAKTGRDGARGNKARPGDTAAKSRKDSTADAAGALGDRPVGLKGQEAVDFKEIQTLYSAGGYDAALLKLTEFEKKYPNSTHIAYARNLHGLSYLLSKKPLQAITQFKKALEVSPSENFRPYVAYNLAAAQADANQLEDSQKTLTEISPDALNNEIRVKYHSLRARNYLKQGSFVDSARESLTLGRFLSEAQQRSPFVDPLEQSLSNISDLAILESLYGGFEDVSLADRVLFRLGMLEMDLGRKEAGEAHLRNLMTRYPKSVHYSAASEKVRPFQAQAAQAPVNSKVVGVLLPMQGKFATFGNQALQAITLAFRIFEEKTGNHFTLVVQDSGDDAETALKALNKLYYENKAIGVVGPLLSKGIDQVTQKAQALGLPLITLAQNPGIAGDYIFPSGLIPRLQAQEIARYAIQTLGLKKFAILHPKDKFGEMYTQAFWDAVESMGGQIVGEETYAAGETDFRHQIDKLSGLYYANETRVRELQEMAKEREALGIKKRTRKTEKYFSLPPIVDYEAVFVPDEPKVVGQILPTFAYRDVDHIKFLGISTWNSPDLVARLQNFAEGAVFTDAFFAQSEAPAIKNFVSRYQTAYGQEPGPIDALAYDAASILEKTLASESPKSRSDLKDELRKVKNFDGITGKISFQNGDFNRVLNVLTVQKGQIIEAEKK